MKRSTLFAVGLSASLIAIPADLVQTAVETQLERSGERVLETIHHVQTLDEAVAAAARIAQAGAVVLFSPGGTSFDAFKDFAERGEKFQELVHGL